MVIVVFEVCGNWRTCSFSPAMSPTSRMSRLTTVASTGRRMKRSVKAFIGRSAHGFGVSAGGGRAGRSSMMTGMFGCSLIWPAITTRSPSFTPSVDRDALAADRAEPYEAPLDHEACPSTARLASPALGRRRNDDEDVVAIEAVDDRGARQGQHLDRARRSSPMMLANMPGSDWRSGLANSARIVTLREFGADAGVDRLDLALESLSGEGADRHRDGLADRDRRQRFLGHRKSA